MTIDTLTKQGAGQVHKGLAGLDADRLKKLRSAQMRACFGQMSDTPFRREFVARVRGREYVNDAASRNVNATWYSLESEQGGLIWIACANNQGDYSCLVPVALRKVRQLIIVGSEAEGMKRAFAGVVPQIDVVATMGEAVKLAYYNDSDDVKVLFSPACDNQVPTRVLGDQFRHEVNEL